MVFTNIQNENKKVELDCNITDIINNNYTINCRRDTENNNYNLQNAISLIKDEILVVHFDDGINSNITFEDKNKYYKRFYRKTGNLSAGAIVAMILVNIVVIAALIATLILLRRKDIDGGINAESVIMKLNN